ncbi:MAG: low molecular weight protein-tyrosine-phosphatase [Rhodospirillales bacterium]
MVKVLFVCLGNICRSPTAEGVFRTLVERQGFSDRIAVDSAGVGSWHVGSPPDRRAQRAARRRGIDLSGQRARQAGASDFRRFDYVVAMDADNRRQLEGLCPPGEEHRLHLLMDFAPELGRSDVPDPYYGGAGGFEAVLDMIERASEGLLAHIRENRL